MNPKLKRARITSVCLGLTLIFCVAIVWPAIEDLGIYLRAHGLAPALHTQGTTTTQVQKPALRTLNDGVCATEITENGVFVITVEPKVVPVEAKIKQLQKLLSDPEIQVTTRKRDVPEQGNGILTPGLSTGTIRQTIALSNNIGTVLLDIMPREVPKRARR